MERLGLVAFSILLLLLIIVRTTMHYWITPPTAGTDERLTAAWNDYKQTHVTTVAKYTSRYAKAAHDTATTDAAPAQLFMFDPNTLDSTGFRRLGLRAKTTAMLLHWRAKGKVFYHKKELKKVYTLQPEEYERIAPYVRIGNR
jgi:hypothetical protein